MDGVRFAHRFMGIPFGLSTTPLNQAGRILPMNLEIRSASAGTGKTTSLVRLYLEALTTTPARRIAAVTFTRASARDLRERLRAGLHQLLETGGYLDFLMPNRQVFERALLELDSCVISTIHGFFRSLLRLNAPSLGLDPEFTNLDETQARDLFRMSASSILARAALEGGVGAALLAQHGWEDALQALETLYQKRVYAPFSGTDPSLLHAFAAAESLYLARLGKTMLSATDVELQTLALLENPPALERIKSRFAHLLVDEFQDVNPLQAQVFTRLGLDKIVFVGDAKQSIYAFRDADVNAFLQMYQRAKALAPLTTSYRHGQRLAQLYSSLAEALFPEFSDLGLPAAVSSGRGADVPSSAELHIVEASDLDGGRNTEARILAERLHQLHQTYAWSEMAILVKTRTSLVQLEPVLRTAQIPFLVGSGQRYYDRREIRDAILILRAKLQPSSPEILASLARFPSINLPLERIELLFDDTRHALRQADFAPLSELLEVIASSFDALSTLEAAWMHLGTNLTREAQSYANLDGLLYQLAARGARDPRAALAFLEQARTGEAEGDEPLEGQDAVRILTIHASKGLEFPVCAVFDLARGERNNTDALVVHPQGEVAWRGTPEFARIQAHWNARRDGEANRLLYVALTRAKDVLLLTGSSTGTPRGWLGTLVQLGLERFKGLEVQTHAQDQQPVLLVESTQDISKLEPHHSLAKSSFKRHSPRVRAPTRAPEAGSEASPDELALDTLHGQANTIPESERVIGTLAHYAIAENFSTNNPHQRRVLAAQYVLHPYTLAEREQMVETAWWYLGRYETLYPDRTERVTDYAELPFAFLDGEVTWQGIIDRLYQLKNGVWVLEDYKTDSVPLPELEQRARAYERQMRVYSQAVRRTWGFSPEVRLTFLHHLVSYALNSTEQAILPPADENAENLGHSLLG
jgi:ATP-dependent helicase/nuclease subunit A